MRPGPLRRSGTSSANGLRHHLLEWDGGGRTTLLCLHGFLDMAWGFAPVAPALAAAGYHVVAPDLRGHGDTEWIGAGGYYHFMDYLHDVADLADAVARDDLVVVGHSMGASIAALFAGVFPERPRAVVAMEGMRLPEQPDEDLPRRAADWIHGVRRARLRGPRVLPDVEACAARIRQFDPLCPPDVALFLAERGTDAGRRAAAPSSTTRSTSPGGPTRSGWSSGPATGAPSAARSCSSRGSRPSCHRPRTWRSGWPACATSGPAVVPGAGHMMMRHEPGGGGLGDPGVPPGGVADQPEDDDDPDAR